jgi:histidinol dehydrogenase
MQIRRLSTKDQSFDAELKALLAFETAQDDAVDVVVANILKDVKARGDAAVLEYTNQFDKTNAKSLADLEVNKPELRAALDGLEANTRAALQSSV